MEHERRSSGVTWGTVVTAVALVLCGITLGALPESRFGTAGGPAVAGVGAGLSLLWFLPLRWHRRVLAAVAATLVSVLAAELALRTLTPWGSVTVYELHARYLHRYVPGARKVYERLPGNGGESVPVHINEQGRRGPPVGKKRATRVAVYGDSCIAAEFTAYENTFVARLGDHLETALGRPVEVVNAGVVGYGPDQSLLRIQDDLETLEPDLVVVAVFADNDFGDLLRNKLFRVDERGNLAAQDAVVPDGLIEEFRSAASPLALEQLLSGTPTLRQRALPVETEADVVREEARVEAWLRDCELEYRHAVVDGRPEVLTLLGDHYDADVALRPESESARHKVRLLELVMGETARACAEGGAALAFLFVPSPVDACDDWDVGRVNRDLHPEYAPTNLTGALRGIAERNDLHHLDLFPVFAERGARELYFRYGNNHWNDTGQDLAAERLARYVAGEVLPR